jgi:hypothetical protein
MIVDRTALRAHILLLLAVVAGVVGMGMVYQGLSDGSLRGTCQGVPFLLVGLWWSGRELGRSIAAGRSRARKRSESPNA